VLFHSQFFILCFLPSVLALYYAAARRQSLREWVLLAASLIFYAWWDVRFLPLLLGQTFVTWGIAEWHHRGGPRLLLWLGVAANLGALLFFKYALFLLRTLAAITHLDVQRPSILLPIGISFFTFQLTCYLIDIARGDGHHYPWRRICLFVSLFPHLIAGPLVRHYEIMPQLDNDPLRPGLAERFSKGLAFFTVGLGKKVFLADALAQSADPVFAYAVAHVPSLGDAWSGSLAFSLQLFLDFSAYTEMAIGIGLMLGVRFPDNFDAPYRASDLREFWRRWHMTLSRMLRDYVYIPLGGSRDGTWVFVKSSLIAMGLCGLWHGAGWTFIVWGLMHGAGLVACRGWQSLARPMPAPAGWLVTMLFVIAGWVLFRAADFATATHMLQGMTGLGPLLPTRPARIELLIAALVSVTGPTTKEFVEQGWLKPQPIQGLLAGSLVVAAVFAVGKGVPQTFIYFQF
jgi:alginate O-acetyltransferase complex protein AlgI